MKKNTPEVLILHGWYSKIESGWYPWLKTELDKKGYKVFLKQLPTMCSGLPDLKKILAFIFEKTCITKNTIVVGHSLGALLALRLAEYFPYKKMLLVAGWDFNDLTKEHRLFWNKPINHKIIRNNVKNIYIFHSDSDPYITAFQAGEMSKRLDGQFFLIKRAGHFGEKDKITKIPQLLKFL